MSRAGAVKLALVLVLVDDFRLSPAARVGLLCPPGSIFIDPPIP